MKDRSIRKAVNILFVVVRVMKSGYNLTMLPKRGETYRYLREFFVIDTENLVPLRILWLNS